VKAASAPEGEEKLRFSIGVLADTIILQVKPAKDDTYIQASEPCARSP